jgi:hypothetical protein
MALGYYPFRVRRRVSWSPDRNKYPPENSRRIELLILVLENTSVLLARLVGFCDRDAGRNCVPGVVIIGQGGLGRVAATVLAQPLHQASPTSTAALVSLAGAFGLFLVGMAI